MQKVGIGLAGLGNVGAGVFKHLQQNRILLMERLGFELKVERIAVRDLNRARSITVPEGLVTTNWQEVLDNPEVQIAVELMGGLGTAYDFVKYAIHKRKIVVTGNKALLAEHGQEIFQLAGENKVPIFFEAAVAGGIPIIKAMREAFIGNHILSIHAIINGTCNYILTRMTEEGIDFPEALKSAQILGFAEADPTLDINGWDAAHKAIILASLAYGFWVPYDKISVTGIEKITQADIKFADRLGYKIKLLATIKADAEHRVEVGVHPTLVPKNHVLASVNGVFNAISVKGDVVGDTLFYGRGAGQDPTTSSVLSDLAEAAVALESPRRSCGFTPHKLYGACKAAQDIVSQYYLRLSVVDEPGVLAQVATILADLQIGIASVIQPERHGADSVPLVLMLHEASYGRMTQALDRIESLSCIKSEPALMRVETFS